MNNLTILWANVLVYASTCIFLLKIGTREDTAFFFIGVCPFGLMGVINIISIILTMREK